MRLFFLIACAVGGGIVSIGCAGPSDTKYPARPEGCEIKVFADTPSIPTDNIGPVTATCDPDVADRLCLRTLQDEACRLGADVVWGVDPAAPQVGASAKKRIAGRAAHTKVK